MTSMTPTRVCTRSGSAARLSISNGALSTDGVVRRRVPLPRDAAHALLSGTADAGMYVKLYAVTSGASPSGWRG